MKSANLIYWIYVSKSNSFDYIETNMIFANNLIQFQFDSMHISFTFWKFLLQLLTSYAEQADPAYVFIA